MNRSSRKRGFWLSPSNSGSERRAHSDRSAGSRGGWWASCQSATLHNEQEFQFRNICIGDVVHTEQLGEVILIVVAVKSGRRAGSEQAFAFDSSVIREEGRRPFNG
jgi:hypothetical protein